MGVSGFWGAYKLEPLRVYPLGRNAFVEKTTFIHEVAGKERHHWAGRSNWDKKIFTIKECPGNSGDRSKEVDGPAADTSTLTPWGCAIKLGWLTLSHLFEEKCGDSIVLVILAIASGICRRTKPGAEVAIVFRMALPAMNLAVMRMGSR